MYIEPFIPRVILVCVIIVALSSPSAIGSATTGFGVRTNTALGIFSDGNSTVVGVVEVTTSVYGNSENYNISPAKPQQNKQKNERIISIFINIENASNSGRNNRRIRVEIRA